MDKTTLGNKLFKAVYKKQVTYKNGKWVSLGKDTTKLSNKNYINTDFSEAGISSFIEDANKLKISPKEVYDIGKMKEKGIDNVSYEDWLSESKILINKRNQSNMESKRPISIKLESRLRLKIRGIVESVLREEDNKNELDNRLYLAIKELASLSNYLSDPKKPINNDEVNRFRNELGKRYRTVDDYISKYASNK